MAKSVEEKLRLTPKQDQAFKELINAVKKCKKANVYFYQVLDTLYGVNGYQIKDVVDDIEIQRCGYDIEDDEHHLNSMGLESVITTCSWADDAHYARMKNEL